MEQIIYSILTDPTIRESEATLSAEAQITTGAPWFDEITAPQAAPQND